MARESSLRERRILDKFLDTILAEHVAGNLTLREAREVIAQLVAHVSRDDGNNVVYMLSLIETRGKAL
jgi:hypothetical protein